MMRDVEISFPHWQTHFKCYHILCVFMSECVYIRFSEKDNYALNSQQHGTKLTPTEDFEL